MGWLPLATVECRSDLIGGESALGQSLDCARSGARADRARASVLKACDQELFDPAFGCMMHERSPHRSECLGKVANNVGPGIDEECAVKVLEELCLVAVFDQPDIRGDTAFTVEEVKRAPRTVGFADNQWGKAVQRVEAPELVGHLAGPAAGLELAERHLWIQPKLVTECADDADLAVVEDLLDLPAWTRQAAARERNGVLARLAKLAVDDYDAATALVWLLIPGATRLANSLRDLSPDSSGWKPAVTAVAVTRLRRRSCATLAVR